MVWHGIVVWYVVVCNDSLHNMGVRGDRHASVTLRCYGDISCLVSYGIVYLVQQYIGKASGLDSRDARPPVGTRCDI